MIRSGSLFSQLLRHFPKTQFARLVIKHEAERHSKGFSCWTQFVSMLFCHLARADSLREICNGLSCCLGKLVHLGIFKGPNKSTLSYANEHRPASLYEELFWTTLAHFRKQGMIGGKKHRFRFKNRLLTLDATVISLCLNMFPWARFQRSKGGVKLHVLLDNADYMPVFVNITEARSHEVLQAHLLKLSPGSIVVMDKAFTDYTLFGRWTYEGVFFVTRLRINTVYQLVSKNRIPQKRNILHDDIIMLCGVHAHEQCPHVLRRVVVWDEVHQCDLELLTNNFDLGASTISEIYRERWQIEVFFKTLKQNLKIKSFVGTSENAIRIQIWTALIALLLLKWLHFISKARWSLSNLASMLRLNLFTYRDLGEWINNPFKTPPLIPDSVQLKLPLLVLDSRR